MLVARYINCTTLLSPAANLCPLRRYFCCSLLDWSTNSQEQQHCPVDCLFNSVASTSSWSSSISNLRASNNSHYSCCFIFSIISISLLTHLTGTTVDFRPPPNQQVNKPQFHLAGDPIEQKWKNKITNT